MVGIILAGGYSSRTKLNKLLLEVNEKPLICQTIETMKPFADKIIVVTGKYDHDLRPHLKGVDIAYNADYALGMFSSILTGIKLVENDDILLLPGDIPNISQNTYKALLSGKGDIRCPVCKGKEGHPLFLSKNYLSPLKQEPIDSNMHKFLNRFSSEKSNIEVDDPFIYFDIDTIDDYNELKKLMERK